MAGHLRQCVALLSRLHTCTLYTTMMNPRYQYGLAGVNIKPARAVSRFKSTPHDDKRGGVGFHLPHDFSEVWWGDPGLCDLMLQYSPKIYDAYAVIQDSRSLLSHTHTGCAVKWKSGDAQRNVQQNNTNITIWREITRISTLFTVFTVEGYDNVIHYNIVQYHTIVG